jgi:hypothetical protein
LTRWKDFVFLCLGEGGIARCIVANDELWDGKCWSRCIFEFRKSPFFIYLDILSCKSNAVQWDVKSRWWNLIDGLADSFSFRPREWISKGCQFELPIRRSISAGWH